MKSINVSGMSTDDIECALQSLEESLLGDEAAMKTLSAMEPTKVSFIAKDTGLQVALEVGNGRLSCRLGVQAEPDVVMEATEETLVGVLSGALDADIAYFCGKLSIRGSLAAAFRLRIKLLGLVQAHAASVSASLAPSPSGESS